MSLSARSPFKSPFRIAAVALLCGCALFSSPAFSGTLSIVSQGRWADVARVLDGDTFVTTRGEHVRLLGINTPEIQHDDSPAQPLGPQASSVLRELIGGQSVRLDFDRERKDAYGRTLAQIHLRDGRWVNGEMVRRGMAHVYTFTPNVGRASDLLALERTARAARLGIWANSRFAVLEDDDVRATNLGQFRLVQGRVRSVSRNGYAFELNGIRVSVPRKYRDWFDTTPVAANGDTVIVRGVVRGASSGLYVALHSPFDMEKIAP